MACRIHGKGNTVNRVLKEVPLEKILCDSDFNVRGDVYPSDIITLAQSIKQIGLNTPITVFPIKNDNKEYQIACGHRRFTAFRYLKKETIPCFIEELDPVNAKILNIVENFERQDLDLIQEARAVNDLKKLGYGIEQIAEKLNRYSSWVNLRNEVFNLPKDMQKELSENKFTNKQIEDIVKLPSAARQYDAIRKLKEYYERPTDINKVIISKPPINEKKSRSKREILIMIGHIIDNLGASFATRCMAWAAGQITTEELYQDIKEQNPSYEIPTEFPDDNFI